MTAATSGNGSAGETNFAGDRQVNEALAREMGLSAEEWARTLETLGRLPTYTELGVVSVMWSEHCSYKSSRKHLARLPTEGPQVVQGPGENAGAVDLGDGWCAVFKMESHNHPSYIEPFQGAATGVGGILRDVFTMGARPVASLNSLRFGRPDHPKTPELLRGVVAGIAHYGNCIGVPMVGGELQFDPSYDGNILVNAFTVGLSRQDGLFFGKATGVGNSVLYVGARTGRDGIHGATMASAEFSDDVEQQLPTVQVGDPFMEKLLLEGCLEIFASDCLEGVQDMGAAGLTSSSVEMADRGGTGIRLNMDAIPRRTRALTPYEMLLSESQERMLMVAKPGREQEVLDICEKWQLDACVIGEVTDTGRFECVATPGLDPFSGSETNHKATQQTVVDLPIALLTSAAPKYDRPHTLASTTRAPRPAPADAAAPESYLLDLLASPNVGSRAWVWHQYDHIVRDGTVLGPEQSDAAVIRLFCGEGPDAPRKYIAISADCDGRKVALHPRQGAAMAVAECTRNVVCSGAKPLGLTDCLNFGNPENPWVMGQFKEAIEGLAEACLALDAPVVSGNVSLYNDTNGAPILPTPTVAVVGQLEDVSHRLTLGFQSTGDSIALLGGGARTLEGSEWWAQHGDAEKNADAHKENGTWVDLGFDLELETRLQNLVLQAARTQLLRSAHDVSTGGMAVCLAECCEAGGLGAEVTLPGQSDALTRWYGEDPSRVVVSTDATKRAALESLAKEHNVPLTWIGTVGGDALSLDGTAAVSLGDIARARASALTSIVGV